MLSTTGLVSDRASSANGIPGIRNSLCWGVCRRIWPSPSARLCDISATAAVPKFGRGRIPRMGIPSPSHSPHVTPEKMAVYIICIQHKGLAPNLGQYSRQAPYTCTRRTTNFRNIKPAFRLGIITVESEMSQSYNLHRIIRLSIWFPIVFKTSPSVSYFRQVRRKRYEACCCGRSFPDSLSF